jgi:hypothetical protein
MRIINATPNHRSYRPDLLIRGKDFICDDGKNRLDLTVGAGSPVISTDQHYFGNNSLYLNGTSWLRITDASSLSFGTGDFTADWWARFTAFGSYNTLIGTSTVGYALIHLWKTSSSTASLKLGRSNVGYQSTCAFSSTNFIDSNWHHLAITRASGVVYMFIDGVAQTVTGSANTTSYTFSASTTCIGSQNGTNQWYAGYLQNIRILNDVCLWTSNFTPPQQADI